MTKLHVGQPNVEINHHPFRCLGQSHHECGSLVQQCLFAGSAIQSVQINLELAAYQISENCDFGINFNDARL